MKVLAVDDERVMLTRLRDCIEKAEPAAEVTAFASSFEALEYAQSGNHIDVAFLDIRMRGANGIELGRQIKAVLPTCAVIFCTGYDDYAFEAISKVHCSGYLLKPVTAEAIRAELDNLSALRGSPDGGSPAEAAPQKRLFVRCFGNFEVFFDDRPVDFQTSKAKELFALLVDRDGAMCRNAEVSDMLWEGMGDHSSYFKKCRKALAQTLEELGQKDVLVRQWGALGINRNLISCDYYEWRAGTAFGINAYNGEYMEQYS